MTIIADTATRTDALTKSVFVMGAEDGIRFIDTLGDVDAIAVTPEGKVLYSRGLAPSLTETLAFRSQFRKSSEIGSGRIWVASPEFGDARGAVAAAEHLDALAWRKVNVGGLHDRDGLAAIEIDRDLKRVLSRGALLDDLPGA